MNLSILYRGPLTSCNYGCHYCPFKNHIDNENYKGEDGEMLNKFVDWIEKHDEHQFSVFFTPSGEALIKPHYQDAMIILSHLPNVNKVVIQTNLSCDLNWIKKADRYNIALWTTFHPKKTEEKHFLKKCSELMNLNIKFSVGMVGLKGNIPLIKRMRRKLPLSVYLWINAFKEVPNYYLQSDIEQLAAIDPHFPINNAWHSSKGRLCNAGESVISVDGNGRIFPCHFIKKTIGNIYNINFEESLKKRQCINKKCHCFIGYVHLQYLGLYEKFGNGILERIPQKQFWVKN